MKQLKLTSSSFFLSKEFKYVSAQILNHPGHGSVKSLERKRHGFMTFQDISQKVNICFTALQKTQCKQCLTSWAVPLIA